MQVKLPTKFRPYVDNYRKLDLGIDLPSWFYHGLKSIDQDFYLVFHPYEVIWDNFINQWEGMIDDYRFTIHEKYGNLNFGWVLTDGQGNPTPDNSWHLWRWCHDAGGVAHILKLESRHGQYLTLVLNRLYLQAKFSDKYGHRAWNRKLADDDAEINAKMRKDKEELFGAIQEENNWLVEKAMDNFSRGITAPTNPTKETIFSAPGVNYRTKNVRPLTDREGGLVGLGDE